MITCFTSREASPRKKARKKGRTPDHDLTIPTIRRDLESVPTKITVQCTRITATISNNNITANVPYKIIWLLGAFLCMHRHPLFRYPGTRDRDLEVRQTLASTRISLIPVHVYWVLPGVKRGQPGSSYPVPR
eukprot:2263491-Rhodomonas_salina.1